jgi:Cof subfamily protein (haloacid dehalogenase superfamily)
VKTLYISDLDGTLLNRQAELSSETESELNRFIQGGTHFSIATARTAATCERILSGVNFQIPVVLMNGVLIYDMSSKHYVKKHVLSKGTVTDICDVMHRTGVCGFMYTLEDDRLATYYEKLSCDAMRAFMDERVKKYNKPFCPVTDFREVGQDVIYFAFMDSYERIHKLFDQIRNVDGVRVEKYSDVYDKDLWYMEIFAKAASKYHAVQYLRDRYGFEKVVAFGDNLNDIPLFEASDVRYAVKNAKDELKAMADAVIESNEENGVVCQIQRIEAL